MKTNEKFLYLLGRNIRKKENSFSDIVKDMCDADEKFLELLFNSCFPFEPKVTPYYILREQQIAKDSRIDFAIQTGKGIYYIENKITDKNIINNAEKYIGHLKGIYKEEANKHLTYILPYKNYEKEPDQLKGKGINCVSWEELIDKCHENEEFYEFASILSSIIQVLLEVPNDEEFQLKRDKCDKLYDTIISSGYLNEKYDEDKWETNRFYGYNFIDNLFFGINFCPIKGVFFCFAYNDNKYKEFIEKNERNINYQMEFKYLKPLGNYHNDNEGYIYLEIRNGDDNDISADIFSKAFEELGKFIQVIDKGKTIPINEFIKNKGKNTK